MPVSWDENQLPALSSWIEEQLPLEGEIVIVSMDIPAGCFAGTADLEDREFVVFANLDNPLADITVNFFLGYIVTLAYDKSGWAGHPPYDVLFDCHRLVCQSLLEFNEEFAKALEDHVDILQAWHSTSESETNEDTQDIDVLMEQANSVLFTVNPSGSKKYEIN